MGLSMTKSAAFHTVQCARKPLAHCELWRRKRKSANETLPSKRQKEALETATGQVAHGTLETSLEQCKNPVLEALACKPQVHFPGCFFCLPGVTWQQDNKLGPNMGPSHLGPRSSRESQQEPAISPPHGTETMKLPMPCCGRWPPLARRHCAQHKVILATTGLDAGTTGTIRLSQNDRLSPPLSFCDVLKGYRKAWNKMKNTNEQLQAISALEIARSSFHTSTSKVIH